MILMWGVGHEVAGTAGVTVTVFDPAPLDAPVEGRHKYLQENSEMHEPGWWGR